MKEKNARMIMGFPNQFWIGVVIMIGVFLKIVYDVSAGFELSTHNVGTWTQIVNDIPNSGHIGVIQYYYTYHHLPNFDPTLIVGYSNPPLFYILSALIVQICHVFIGWPIGSVLHCIQCLNAVFVMAGCFIGLGMLGKMGLKGKKYVACLVFVMFFPGFYTLGASLDNTPLAFLFAMLAMSNMVKWYELRTTKCLYKCGIFLGLGMMTSLTALAALVPIVVLYLFARFYDRRSTVKVWAKQGGISLAIALVLGFFYPVRNLIRFGTPIFYIDQETAAWQQVGSYSLWQRIGLPSFQSLTHLHLSEETYYEYNIWGQLFKTSVVDESALNLDFRITHLFAVVLLVLVILFAVLSTVMFVRMMFAGRVGLDHRLFLLSGLVTAVIAYMVTCLTNATVSTMNFRLFPFAVFFLLAGFGLCGKYNEQDGIFEKVTTRIGVAMIIAISVLSAFLFGFYAL